MDIAIHYEKSSYSTDGKRLMGRNSATESFLKALIQYGTAENIYCFTSQKEDYYSFCQQAKVWAGRTDNLSWIPSKDPAAARLFLEKAGLLYRPDPVITVPAWRRRFHSPQTYSICGITHTIASKSVMQAIGDLLTAPVEPWDAVICTSQAVKKVLERIAGQWGDYLVDRLGGGRPSLNLQLPVIPLGIDMDSFPSPHEKTLLRATWRDKLGIGKDDIVVMFFGRLNFYSKAHPVPFYLALQQAAEITGKSIHLLEVGWFENDKEMEAYNQAVNKFCPKIHRHYLDGRNQKIKTEIWGAADIFVSLVDNIQETFGLTPVEAMANGIPVIVSDWNGYKETVEHEVEGFRIPTIGPPTDSNLAFSELYWDDQIHYGAYVANVSATVAVNISVCVNALVSLIENPNLRRKMGDAGFKKAREIYHWSNIIKQYEELWKELISRQKWKIIQRKQYGKFVIASEKYVPPANVKRASHPLCDDPFYTFAHYPSKLLSMESRFYFNKLYDINLLQKMKDNGLVNFGEKYRFSIEKQEKLWEIIRIHSSISLKELISQYKSNDLNSLIRTLMHGLKFGILNVK